MKRSPIVLAVAATAALIISGCTASPTPSPTAEPAPTVAPTAAPEATEPPVPSPTVEVIEIESETLDSLDAAQVPIASLIELARRLGGVTRDIPEMLDPPAVPFQVGSRQVFHASNQDTNEQFDVTATLQYATDHAYFWIADGPNSMQMI